VHALVGEQRFFFIVLCILTFRLDGKHVAFGQVIDGMDVLLMAEEFGTDSGRPLKRVVIADCGQLN